MTVLLVLTASCYLHHDKFYSILSHWRSLPYYVQHLINCHLVIIIIIIIIIIVIVDIVFLKAWIPVTVPQLYNPVTSLLLPVGGKDVWKGMKTVGELKRDRGIQNSVNSDHLYRVFQPELYFVRQSHLRRLLACWYSQPQQARPQLHYSHKKHENVCLSISLNYFKQLFRLLEFLTLRFEAL